MTTEYLISSQIFVRKVALNSEKELHFKYRWEHRVGADLVDLLTWG